jgi:prolyl 4-hydroxylase
MTRLIRHPVREHIENDADALFIPRLPFVATVDEVLDERECAEQIARIESLSPSAAPITLGPNRFEHRPDYRNNDRVIVDDAALASLLFERMRDAIPGDFDGGVACGLNERFRCYRYTRGQRFAPHFDGCYRRNDKECSEITVLVYLNEGCDGGETAFGDFDVVIKPKRGMALLFQHNMLHEGVVVRGGEKYVLRSDVMYRAP